VFGLVDGEPYPAGWASPDGLDVMFLKWRAERHPWPGGDPRAPSSKDIDRFVTARSAFAPGELEQSPLHQRCVAPLGVIDQVRMMLCSEGRHIGWIGAMRAGGDEPFGERELRRLHPSDQRGARAGGRARASGQPRGGPRALAARR
jgi:hypothetical protein